MFVLTHRLRATRPREARPGRAGISGGLSPSLTSRDRTPLAAIGLAAGARRAARRVALARRARLPRARAAADRSTAVVQAAPAPHYLSSSGSDEPGRSHERLPAGLLPRPRLPVRLRRTTADPVARARRGRVHPGRLRERDRRCDSATAERSLGRRRFRPPDAWPSTRTCWRAQPPPPRSRAPSWRSTPSGWPRMARRSSPAQAVTTFMSGTGVVGADGPDARAGDRLVRLQLVGADGEGVGDAQRGAPAQRPPIHLGRRPHRAGLGGRRRLRLLGLRLRGAPLRRLPDLARHHPDAPRLGRHRQRPRQVRDDLRPHDRDRQGLGQEEEDGDREEDGQSRHRRRARDQGQEGQLAQLRSRSRLPKWVGEWKTIHITKLVREPGHLQQRRARDHRHRRPVVGERRQQLPTAAPRWFTRSSTPARATSRASTRSFIRRVCSLRRRDHLAAASRSDRRWRWPRGAGRHG